MTVLDFPTVTRTIASTARRVLTASIAGAGDPGDDGSAERVDGCEVVQPLGFYARPVLSAQTEAVTMRFGDDVVIIAIVDKSRAAQAVEEGEARMYGPGSDNATANVRIRATGAVNVNAKTNTNVVIIAGGTGVVVLQDGSQAFVRGNDYSTALNACMDALKVFNLAVGTFATAAGGAVPALVAPAATLNTAIGVANAAIDTFKASSSTWLSTKVTGQ